jgi:hypothetical protein
MMESRGYKIDDACQYISCYYGRENVLEYIHSKQRSAPGCNYFRKIGFNQPTWKYSKDRLLTELPVFLEIEKYKLSQQ